MNSEELWSTQSSCTKYGIVVPPITRQGDRLFRENRQDYKCRMSTCPHDLDCRRCIYCNENFELFEKVFGYEY